MSQKSPDLQRICSYIGQFDSDAALRTGNGIVEHVGILSDFPFIGPVYPRGADGPLRQIVFRSSHFYDVDEQSQAVSILHVRHGAREEPILGQ